MFFFGRLMPFVLMSILPLSIFADSGDILDSEASPYTETVVVAGARSERNRREIAATIDVKTATQIERELIQGLEDLFRFEPGLSSAGTGSRFGFSGFSIRGIGGNRVLTVLDGVRVPEAFSFGPFLSARRNFIDVDSLSRAEVARGPISSLYGSDALGGVVALSTKGPNDYLRAGKRHYGSVKVAGSSADSSDATRLTLALGGENSAALVLFNRRQSEETETRFDDDALGPTRRAADPQDANDQNILVKWRGTFVDSHEVTVSFDQYENETRTRILSDYNVESFGVTVARRDAEDERKRLRGSLAYVYQMARPIADKLSITAYLQDSESRQLTVEDRLVSAGKHSRLRDSAFAQKIAGGFAQFEKNLEFAGHRHDLIYGIETTQTDNETLRFGETQGENGERIAEFFPFPTRDFPLTTVTQSAFFLQDTLHFYDDKLILSPSIRYDRYGADVTAEEIYISGNPGTPIPEDYDDHDVSKKLGLVYKLNTASSAYLRYSEGFRAPPYDDVNVGFSNFIGGYKTISNTNLESETSQGVEIGFRFVSDNREWHVAAFRNEYDNFIESLALAPQFRETGGIDPSDNQLTFQSINRSAVLIEGAEMSGQWNLYSSHLAGVSLRSSIAYARGEDEQTLQALNSVEPLTGILGIGYSSPGQHWGIDVLGTWVQGKKNSQIDADNPRMETASHSVLDVLAYWSPTKKTHLNIGLFNLTDKKYIRWADTAAIGDSAPERFSQPGFNVAASIVLEL